MSFTSSSGFSTSCWWTIGALTTAPTCWGPYITAGEVELLSAPCPKKWQGRRFDTYQCALLKIFCELLRGVSRWVAFIDLDEFIVPVETANVPDFLRKHEDRGGIYVRWEPFGTSYIKKLPPNALVTGSFYLKWKFIKGHEMLGKSSHVVSGKRLEQTTQSR